MRARLATCRFDRQDGTGSCKFRSVYLRGANAGPGCSRRPGDRGFTIHNAHRLANERPQLAQARVLTGPEIVRYRVNPKNIVREIAAINTIT